MATAQPLAACQYFQAPRFRAEGTDGASFRFSDLVKIGLGDRPFPLEN